MSSGSAGKRERAGVHWDESNLQENEIIKAELQPIKIIEPKTPYHGPTADSDDDGSGHMMPLTLEGEEDQEQASIHRENGAANRLEEHDSSDMDRSSPSRHTSWEGSPKSYYSSDDERKVEKRQKFEQHRRQHYQMREAKEALRRSKALIEQEEAALRDAEEQKAAPQRDRARAGNVGGLPDAVASAGG